MFIKCHFSLSVSLPLSLSSYLSLQSCQADLVKDNGHKYFLSVLADSYMPVSKHRSPLCICGKSNQCQIIFFFTGLKWVQQKHFRRQYIIDIFTWSEISQVLSLLQAEHRTMAVFILAVIVNSYNTGQVWECVCMCEHVWIFCGQMFYFVWQHSIKYKPLHTYDIWHWSFQLNYTSTAQYIFFFIKENDV